MAIPEKTVITRLIATNEQIKDVELRLTHIDTEFIKMNTNANKIVASLDRIEKIMGQRRIRLTP